MDDLAKANGGGGTRGGKFSRTYDCRGEATTDLAALGADGEELTAGTTKAGPDATPGQPVLARLDAMQNQARGLHASAAASGWSRYSRTAFTMAFDRDIRLSQR